VAQPLQSRIAQGAPVILAVAACAEEATAPEPSPTAAQADAIAVQSVTDFLKAEAERPKAVTKLLAHQT
jgi:hypothetical protein